MTKALRYAGARFFGFLFHYARIAWSGFVSTRLREESLVVVQAVIVSDQGILLTVRTDLWGWELPGGNLHPDEEEEVALLREVFEETGYRVSVDRFVGEYARTGFLPHRARVYRCSVIGGKRQLSHESVALQWFSSEAIPGSLFPWYHAPIQDALSMKPPVHREERLGLGSILTGMMIDLRMRWNPGFHPEFLEPPKSPGSNS